VHRTSGDESEWPFPCEHDESEEHVDALEDGEGLHCWVEVLREEIPEDLGPEETVETGADLINSSRKDDEASPVVLDKFSHLDLKNSFRVLSNDSLIPS